MIGTVKQGYNMKLRTDIIHYYQENYSKQLGS